jgi:hypothetical protein
VVVGWWARKMSGAGCDARAAYDKKEQTPLRARSSHPLDISRRFFRCFRHTSRCATMRSREASGLEKPGARNQTIQIRQPGIMRLTGLTAAV